MVCRTLAKKEKSLIVRKDIILIISVAISFILFTGCPSPPGDNVSTKPTIISAQWDIFEGAARFLDNDTKDYGQGSMLYLNNTDGLTPVEIQVKKINGAENNGYGIIFAYQSDGSYYRFLIDTGGWGQVSKINADGSSTELLPWTQNSAINTGYDVLNILSAVYNSSPASYDVLVNGTNILNFDGSSSGSLLSGGKSGFFVSIGNEASEGFPDTPVDVRFNMITPINYP